MFVAGHTWLGTSGTPIISAASIGVMIRIGVMVGEEVLLELKDGRRVLRPENEVVKLREGYFWVL